MNRKCERRFFRFFPINLDDHHYAGFVDSDGQKMYRIQTKINAHEHTIEEVLLSDKLFGDCLPCHYLPASLNCYDLDYIYKDL